MPHTWDSDAIDPVAALRRLAQGNARFRTSTLTGTAVRPWTPQLATEAQRPFAIILGCSDSRTPVEILFDQGFGDLFVVRIAGNVVAPSVVGSIEFAAAQFGTRLVVVMGHTRCGAVGATIRALETDRDEQSRNIRDITDRIAPHVESLVHSVAEANGGAEAKGHLLREAVVANVRASADHLRHGSRLLEELVLAGRVVVVGANYELETGKVDFFDGVPAGVDLSSPEVG
jgi:carbonic anhydrase